MAANPLQGLEPSPSAWSHAQAWTLEPSIYSSKILALSCAPNASKWLSHAAPVCGAYGCNPKPFIIRCGGPLIRIQWAVIAQILVWHGGKLNFRTGRVNRKGLLVHGIAEKEFDLMDQTVPSLLGIDSILHVTRHPRHQIFYKELWSQTEALVEGYTGGHQLALPIAILNVTYGLLDVVRLHRSFQIGICRHESIPHNCGRCLLSNRCAELTKIAFWRSAVSYIHIALTGRADSFVELGDV